MLVFRWFYILIFLTILSCGNKGVENIKYVYDENNVLKSIEIQSKTDSSKVTILLDENYKVSNILSRQNDSNQKQKISFHKNGSISSILNLINVNNYFQNNQLYAFDENLNIIDTSSFFGIFDVNNDSIKMLYFSNYKNSIRRVFFIDSITKELEAFHPVSDIVIEPNRNYVINNKIISTKKIDVLKLVSYKDSLNSRYNFSFYFLTNDWKNDINFVEAPPIKN